MPSPTVFICYAHADKVQVNSLVETLRAGGYEALFDFELIPGQGWKEQLSTLIKSCDAFVYVMTPESLASEWCQWELKQAAEMSKPVIPVRLQTNLDLPEELGRIQWVDFSNGATPHAVAKLMYGLRFSSTISPKEVTESTQNPRGIPPQGTHRGFTKVLIVEDELNLANNLATKLRDEGYNVITSSDGEDGLDKARYERPDLIVLDIMLPRLDGLSLCRIIRHDTSTAHIPIIMLTARGTEVDKIVGLESGADDYVVKPVALGEFLARVRAVMRRNSGRPIIHDELSSNDLLVSLTGRRVYKGDEEIKVSNKEFDLLVELVRNKGAVLSRDLILTKVWGYDSYTDKRTVDVHIRWLREKIEDDASDPRRIVTVRGVGYRFEG